MGNFHRKIRKEKEKEEKTNSVERVPSPLLGEKHKAEVF